MKISYTYWQESESSLAERTGQPLEKIEKDTDRDFKEMNDRDRR